MENNSAYPQALEYWKHWERVNKSKNDRSPSISGKSRENKPIQWLFPSPFSLYELNCINLKMDMNGKVRE